ncbi:MAG TPA: hypothetical protein VIL36_13845 [Acidimicrobiales bacterium]
MEWTRALDLAAGRMFPAVALRQLLDERRRRRDVEDVEAARPVTRRALGGNPGGLAGRGQGLAP